MTERAQPQHLAFPDEAFRYQRPDARAPRPLVIPRPATFTLANGIEVYLIEQHALPLVSLDLYFEGGELAIPRGTDGLSSIAMSLLTEGTRALDKVQYSAALGDLGSSVSAYATDDGHGLAMSTLTRHLDATFDVFAATLLDPGLRRADFERLVKRRIETVRQARGTPSSIASRVQNVILYGADHPFGAVISEESLARLTLEQCAAFTSTYLRPARAQLFVVGDLTEAEIRARFETGLLAAWTGEAPAIPAVPPPRPAVGEVFAVDVPGATQSQISLLHTGPPRRSPDFHATTLVGAILGGGFASRLNMNLREAKGYSYGVRGGFQYTRDTGIFLAAGSVAAPATRDALAELRREIDDLASGRVPATAQEIAREKAGAILAFPGRFATAQSSLGQFRSLVYFELPLDTFDGYTARIEAVTAEDVAASARAHLDLARASTLIVGDPAHRPDATVLDADGRPM